MQRIQIIRQRLEAAFSPAQLEVIDDSHLHVGHAGASGGAGHYSVIIAAACFDGQSRIDSHRMIYGVLDDLIPQEVHALRITVEP